MAAIYLEPLDHRMESTALTYARFMDDWVVLASRVEQRPDKTFIGRIGHGSIFGLGEFSGE